jgi:hypothetical protein
MVPSRGPAIFASNLPHTEGCSADRKRRERLVDTASGLFLLPSVVLEEDEDGAGEGGR